MTRWTLICLGGALAATGLTGCGGGGGGSTIQTAPAPQPHSLSASLPNGLTATVAADRATVPVQGVVTYTLTLTNSTAQPITFQPMRPAAFSVDVGDVLTVRNAAGTLTYPLGEYDHGLTTVASVTLAPGKSLSATEGVGIYNTGGTFPAVGRYYTSVTFTVQTPTGALVSATAGPLAVDVQ